MHIVHVVSELAPITPEKSFGEAIFGLTKALAKLRHQVTIYLPKYDCIAYSLLENLQILTESLYVEKSSLLVKNTLWSATYDSLDLILVEPHPPAAYFERGKIYGEEDDQERFFFFCQAVSAHIKQNLPQAVHLHDWPSAACAILLKNLVPTVFTIHNLHHCGRSPSFYSQEGGSQNEEEQMSSEEIEDSEALNLLKSAFYASTFITTVSPSYMKEILTPEGGRGLENDLQKNKKKLQSILYGIDSMYWNPEIDPFLIEKYTRKNFSKWKGVNKRHLQKYLGLLEGDMPLVIAITKFISQRDQDLIYYGMEKTIQLGGQFVLLDTGPPSEMEGEIQSFSTHPNISILFEYDECLAHLLYAAGDMFLMPSIFEPCGFVQLIALRYGCIPLVRAIGGLKDTVSDGQNGFTFDIPDNKGVSNALEKAFSLYPTQEWKQYIQRGMESDHSWQIAAEKYAELYKDQGKTWFSYKRSDLKKVLNPT